MYIQDWKKEILTIPNLLSLLRLILLPVYVPAYLRAETERQYFMAGSIMILSCLTDLLDGRIARKHNMISNVGKILDPIADKATQFVLIVCFCARYRVMKPVLVLFVVKEAFQLIACVLALNAGKALPGALIAGKICTAVLFASLIFLILFSNLSPQLVNFIAAVDAIFLAISFISYVMAYYGKNPKLEDFHA